MQARQSDYFEQARQMLEQRLGREMTETETTAALTFWHVAMEFGIVRELEQMRRFAKQ